MVFFKWKSFTSLSISPKGMSSRSQEITCTKMKLMCHIVQVSLGGAFVIKVSLHKTYTQKMAKFPSDFALIGKESIGFA